ncbi:MAG: hypothetical protein DWQ40_01145 [Actinobacteria bacterium]|nr:MAG: hypothetical protein DWQ40_01145 [Actinomycetota bacterium]REK34662.1 MAG: hypothetical protein DWQ20_06765 [Actinomycetota bacterium]
MAEIPESLLRRSAEAKAKALGVPVEDVLAEMKGEGPPVKVPQPEAEEKTETVEVSEAPEEPATEPVEEVEPPEDKDAPTPEVEADTDQDVIPEEPKEATYADDPDPDPVPPPAEPAPEQQPVAAAEAEETPAAVAVADKEEEESPAPPSGNGAGNGKVASVVSARPSVPPAGTPEGVRSQRLLTVVKARAIQNVKAEPTDKVNTWPHLMLMEFGALLLITGILVVMSIVIHSPLLDPANFNATPNPSKAPWYFLGLQELLSYFDPQIAGVMVPTVTGMALFILVPYLDKNPSTTPSDRKFAIALYSIFLAGAATLTIIGVLFRGLGFNWAYPWQDGIFFDDLKDWVHFE